MRRALLTHLVIGALAVSTAAALSDGSEPIVPFWRKGAKIFLVQPVDHASLAGKVVVKFIQSPAPMPAGDEDQITDADPYLLLDSDLPMAYEFNKPLPADSHHLPLHLNSGEVTLELAPGNHTLQLIAVDQQRVPHYPPLISPRITILVK